MGYLSFTLVAGALFAGFLFVTRYETRQGVRFFSTYRSKLDTRAEHFMFILTHVDFESFAREQVRVLSTHIAHDIAHLSLLVVRTIERFLSRLVKHLRTRHGIETASHAAPRAFVKTMSDFKQHLTSTRPEIPEI